jgi:hypothetical protein
MDTRSWQSSANQYYAFDGEEHDLPHRISKTPPPLSTSRSSRSPLPATCTQKSAPTSPMYGPSTLPKSSLLDRISPKRYSPHSNPASESPPLPPELGDYSDSHLGEEEEEEEQVIRVLDNNQELVYQRDFEAEERQDQDGDPHEPRNSNPVKKRKLVHPNQSTSSSTPQSSPTQNKSNLMTKHPRSKSCSPSAPQSIASPSSQKQPLAPRSGVDWSSSSPMKSGSHFGQLSSLTFGFGGHDASAEVNTTGETTSRDRIEAATVPEPSRDDRYVDEDDSFRLEDKIDKHEPTPPRTTMIARDRREEGGISNRGTSLLHRIGGNGPISDPELVVPLEGGEDHDLDHATNHEEGDMIECDASLAVAPSLIPPSLSEDIPMDPPPPPRKSPRTPIHEEMRKGVSQSASVTSSGKFTPSPQAEGADEGIKTMEQHAEDLLQDIHKEYLSRTEARAAFPPTELGVFSGLPGGASMSHHDHNEHPRSSPTTILDGISPPVGTRSISPILGNDLRYLTSDAISTSNHASGSTPKNLHSSIARSASDLDPYDTFLKADPELDQITKQALGDLIVHNLKLSHNLDANDAVRSAIKLEVDEHARDFLRLATKLARRMDLIGEPLGGTVKAQDAPPNNHLLVEPTLSDTAENGYLEYLPPIEGSEDSEEPQPPKGDVQPVPSDVEIDSVPPKVSRSDSEDKVKSESNDHPAGEQEPDVEPTDEHAERVDHVESDDEDDSHESGLDIPGVWCARTGRDRTDTLQEHVEVSKVLAARVKKWVRKNGSSKE